MSERRIATVLMLDVVGSTHIASELGDARYRALSTRFDRIVRAALRRFGGREEDHAGDGFFATFSQPDRTIRCAATIADEVRELGIEIRAGIHTGQTEDQGGKAQGIAVVIGARVMSLAGESELLVTSTTKELVTGSGFGFEDLSAHELKGVPGTWQVFAVTSVDEEPRPGPLPPADAAERRAAIGPLAPGRKPRRLPAVAALGAVTAVVIAVVALTAREDGPTRSVPRGDAAPAQESVVELDPETGEILVEIPAPVDQRGRPGFQRGTPDHAMALGQGGVWILRSYRWLYHVDPRSDELRSEIMLDIGGGPSFSLNIAVGLDEIWIAHDRGLTRVDPATEDQRLVVPIRAATGSLHAADVTLGDGHVWLITTEGRLVRFDPRTGRSRSVRLPESGDVVAFSHGSVWIGDTVAATVTRYDPETLSPEPPIEVPQGVDNIVIGDRVWVLSQSADVLTPVDPDSGQLGTSVPVGEDPTGLATGGGAVWVGDEDGMIRRVDENTREVTEIPFGSEVRSLAYDDETGTLWVDVAGPF